MFLVLPTTLVQPFWLLELRRMFKTRHLRWQGTVVESIKTEREPDLKKKHEISQVPIQGVGAQGPMVGVASAGEQQLHTLQPMPPIINDALSQAIHEHLSHNLVADQTLPVGIVRYLIPDISNSNVGFYQWLCMTIWTGFLPSFIVLAEI